MPDFFEGKPADISWYPPDNKEKEQKLGEFFGTQAAPPKTIENVGKVVGELKQKYPDIKQWGILGFCWGGKVRLLASAVIRLILSRSSISCPRRAPLLVLLHHAIRLWSTLPMHQRSLFRSCLFRPKTKTRTLTTSMSKLSRSRSG